MEAKRQDIGMDIDENKKDTQNKTNTQDKADTSNKKDKPDGSEKEEAQKSTSASREILSWVLTFALAIGAAFLIKNYLIINADVPTGSMENTIMAGDRILALRTSYWFDEPEAGDIVVFRYPDDETGKTLYVKRIIGTPGDTVEMSNGTVYVNGKTLQEDYIAEVTQGSYGPYVVPDGCYFMMGDNRNHSQDSRFWRNQYVEKDEILGKVVLRYYKGFKWIS